MGSTLWSRVDASLVHPVLVRANSCRPTSHDIKGPPGLGRKLCMPLPSCLLGIPGPWWDGSVSPGKTAGIVKSSHWLPPDGNSPNLQQQKNDLLFLHPWSTTR